MNPFSTKTVGKNFAEVREDIILQEEPMARLVFRAQIHKDGVRGRMIRQRRLSKDDRWSNDTAIDIRTLEKGDTFNVELKTEAVNRLISEINRLSDHIKTNGIEFGSHKYKTVKADSVIVNRGNISDVIEKIIAGNHTQEVLEAFARQDNLDTGSFVDAERIRLKRRAIEELESRLASGNTYPETKGDDSWQKFIFNRSWMFGATYLDPIDRTRINISGSMPDFIYPTADGFADILEIKLPTDSVILQDSSHSGSWKWMAEVSSSIGQVANYLADMDRLRLEIERQIKTVFNRDVVILKPRGYVLIGNSADWSQEKIDGLRKLNSILHDVEVITYRDLIRRAERIVE